MKADTGRILRQRFCFLMAMVSCEKQREVWGWGSAPSILKGSLPATLL